MKKCSSEIIRVLHYFILIVVVVIGLIAIVGTSGGGSGGSGDSGSSFPTGDLTGTWEGVMYPGHNISFEVEELNGEYYITSAYGDYVAIGCINDLYFWEGKDLQNKIINNECHIYFDEEISIGDNRAMELHFYFDSNLESHGTWVGETFCDPYLIEGGFTAFHCVDNDGDGYDSCNECNDDNSNIHWDADEICDGVDNDCDGEIDEGLFYPDVDQDGYGDASAPGQSCPVPENSVVDNTDCNDSNLSINPGKEEICGNFIDDNCDGQIEEGCETISSFDIDSPGAITISPDGEDLYVANSLNHIVQRIRTSDNLLIKTISVDGNPYELSVTQDGQYLYVLSTKSGPGYLRHNMSVIRTSDNAVIDTIALGYYIGSGGMTILPNGDYIYMANHSNDTVSVLQTSDYTIIDTIPVDDFPSNLITAPNGDFVYVSNSTSSSISVIRTSDNTVTDTIPIGSKSRGMTITQDGNYVYVTEEIADTISVIRTSDNSIIGTIPVGPNPWGATVSPDEKYVYVVNRGEVTYCPGCPVGSTENWIGCSVSVILTSNNSVLHNIPMGNGPAYTEITPNGDYVYVTVNQENKITVIEVPDYY